LIVTKAIPCRRESNGRHATIPDGQEITILSPVKDSNDVRFSVAFEGKQETFTTFPSTISRCCGDAKPVQQE
jgi:hypothetical protein